MDPVQEIREMREEVESTDLYKERVEKICTVALVEKNWNKEIADSFRKLMYGKPDEKRLEWIESTMSN